MRARSPGRPGVARRISGGLKVSRRRQRYCEVHRDAAHCADVADIDGDGFVSHGVGRMHATSKVCAFNNEIGAIDQAMAGWHVENGRIVTDAYRYG